MDVLREEVAVRSSGQSRTRFLELMQNIPIFLSNHRVTQSRAGIDALDILPATSRLDNFDTH